MCSMRKSDYEALIESLYFGMVLPRGNGMDAAETAGGGDRTHTIALVVRRQSDLMKL